MYDFLDKIGLKAVMEAIKGKMPTSLPANGGNADYATNAGNANAVGGIQISDIRQITRNAIQTLPTPPIAECDYFVSNADSTFPYYFGNLSIRYGSYTAEFVAIYQTTGDDKSIWYNLYLGGWVGWKEISTTPIKSTTFSGTTGNSGNMAIWNTSERKIPLFVEIVDCYCFPFLSSSSAGCYMIHAFDSNGDKALTTVSGTVYYIEI